MTQYVDRTLACQDCGQLFTFLVRDQRFHDLRGYLDPKRCLSCRERLKQRRERLSANE